MTPKFEFVCTFAGSVDESAFLVSVPLKNGKPMEWNVMQKLFFLYRQGSEKVVIAGYADDILVDGIRKFWRIRRVQEQRQFFQRADEQYKVALRIEYMQDTWKPNDEGKIAYEEGMTLDISAGGVAMFMNHVFDVGETVYLKMPGVGAGGRGALDEDAAAVVCWMREAPKGSAYRHVCGLRFKFSSEEDQYRMKDYVDYVKRCL